MGEHNDRWKPIIWYLGTNSRQLLDFNHEYDIMYITVPKATVTPAFTTPYDDLRWVNFGDRGPSGVNRV